MPFEVNPESPFNEMDYLKKRLAELETKNAKKQTEQPTEKPTGKKAKKEVAEVAEVWADTPVEEVKEIPLVNPAVPTLSLQEKRLANLQKAREAKQKKKEEKEKAKREEEIKHEEYLIQLQEHKNKLILEQMKIEAEKEAKIRKKIPKEQKGNEVVKEEPQPKVPEVPQVIEIKKTEEKAVKQVVQHHQNAEVPTPSIISAGMTGRRRYGIGKYGF